MDPLTLFAFSLALILTLDLAASRIGHGPTRRPLRSRRG